MITKIISALLVFTILGTATLVAQSTQTDRDRKAAEIEAKIKKLGTGQRSTVKIKLYTETKYEGYVSQANDNDFVLVDRAGGSHTVKYSDVKSIGGRGLSSAAKLGIGIGIGAGAVLAVL